MTEQTYKAYCCKCQFHYINVYAYCVKESMVSWNDWNDMLITKFYTIDSIGKREYDINQEFQVPSTCPYILEILVDEKT